METLGLNVTDLVILFVIGSSGIVSLFRGFTKEFLSLLLWIFAFFAAVGLEGYATPEIAAIIGNEEASKIIELTEKNELSKPLVLVVEDAKLCAKMLARTLRGDNVDADCVYNGQEALDTIKRYLSII